MAFTAHQKASVGDIKFSAVSYSHLGWILCDGSTLNVADFQFLFNVIGYSFGGSGTQFILPNPAGRVPGVIGIGNDANLSTMSTVLGQSIGEYVHQLTIPEMPIHNHGVNGSIAQNASNNSTSVVATGITNLTHSHGLDLNNNGVTSGVGTANVVVGGGSDTNTANVVMVDPGHAHVLNPAGGDRAHNNVQPTLFMGNMFIYTGLPRYGASVYQTGKNLW